MVFCKLVDIYIGKWKTYNAFLIKRNENILLLIRVFYCIVDFFWKMARKLLRITDISLCAQRSRDYLNLYNELKE